MNPILDMVAAASWQSLLLWLVRVTVIAGFGLGALALARRAAAATRHLIAVATLAAVVAFPAATLLLPGWAVPVLPARIPAGPSVTPWHAYLAAVDVPETSFEGDPAPASAKQAIVGPPEPASGSPSFQEPAAPFSLPPIRWPAAALVAWLVVAAVLLARFALSTAAAGRIAGRAEDVTDERLQGEFERARLRMDVGPGIALRMSPETSVPVVLGVLHPTLVLPFRASEWESEKLRVVLLHELAHVRRRDPLSLAVSRLATAVAWFHPLVWVLARTARRECERACDDAVLADGVKPSAYAEHLLSIVRSMVETDRLAGAALTFAMTSNLERRLSAILRADTRRGGISRRRAAAAALLAAVLLIPAASVRLVAAPARPSKSNAIARAQASLDQERKLQGTATGKSSSGIGFVGPLLSPSYITPLIAAATVNESGPEPLVVQEDAALLAGNGYGKDESSSKTEEWSSKDASSKQSGREWFSMGREHYRADEYEEAAAAYYNAARAGYRIGTSYYNAACSFALAGQKNWALSTLRQALETGFDQPELVASDDDLDSIRDDARFQPLLDRAMKSNSAEATKTSARARYEALLSARSNESSEWKSVGLDLLRLGDYDRAAVAFQRQFDAERDTPSANALYNLACAKARGGNCDEALDALARAITSGSVDADHMAKDADLASLRKDDKFGELVELADDLTLSSGGKSDDDVRAWRRSLPRFESVAQKHPSFGRAWFNLGLAQLRAEEPKASIASYERSLKLDYRRPTSMYNLACANAQAGDHERAFYWLERSKEAGMDMDLAAWDKDLDPIRSDSRFERLMDRWGVQVASDKHETKKNKNKTKD